MAMLRVAAGLFFLSVGVASAQSPGSAGTAPSVSTDEAEILQIDQKIADAVVRGDTAFVDSMLAVDFSMVHGDQWTTGGRPLLTDDKKSFLRRVAIYVSHRTVRGAKYGLDRASVQRHSEGG